MKLFTLFFIFIFTQGLEQALGEDVYTGIKCVDRGVDVTSVCQGRSIPVAYARNKSKGHLECTGNTDHYIRTHFSSKTAFDIGDASSMGYDAARSLQVEMQKDSPDIKWEGTIPYQTVEVWSYQLCELVVDRSACGYHIDTTTYEEEQCETKYDEEGNPYDDCKMVTVEESVEHTNSCHDDVTYNKSWDCSHERMTYDAYFKKPSESEWNPGMKDYFWVLPNKYDLLPGEMEDIQVYSNTSRSRSLSPKVEIGNAWNKYSVFLSGSANGAACRQNSDYHLSARIETDGRDPSKQAPNALRLPTDLEGNQLDQSQILVWNSGVKKQNVIEKAFLDKIRLEDTSAATIKVISQQSRENAAREEAKREQGKGGDSFGDEKPDEGELKSFFKNTHIMVRLIEDPIYGWPDEVWSSQIYTDANVLEIDNNLLSQDKTKYESDTWLIDLDDVALRPNRNYRVEISMYQKGIPFYKQSCEDAKEIGQETGFGCSGFAKFFKAGRKPKHYFSKPIVLNFKTPKDYDNREGFKATKFYNAPDSFFHMLFGGGN